MKFSKKIPRMTNLRRVARTSSSISGNLKEGFRSSSSVRPKEITLLETFLGERIHTFNGEELSTIEPTFLYTIDGLTKAVTLASEDIVLLK